MIENILFVILALGLVVLPGMILSALLFMAKNPEHIKSYPLGSNKNDAIKFFWHFVAMVVLCFLLVAFMVKAGLWISGAVLAIITAVMIIIVYFHVKLSFLSLGRLPWEIK